MFSTLSDKEMRANRWHIIRHLAEDFPTVKTMCQGIVWLIIYIPLPDGSHYKLFHRLRRKQWDLYPDSRYPMIPFEYENEVYRYLD